MGQGAAASGWSALVFPPRPRPRHRKPAQFEDDDEDADENDLVAASAALRVWLNFLL